jgi:protein-L-isoaspartate(D-aspartate) O-methyltransferase
MSRLSKKYFTPLSFLLIFLFALPALSGSHQTLVDDFVCQRRLMVDKDLRGLGIKDSMVPEAMNAIPRHLFVPERARPFAYQDRTLPIGKGQTISQPYVVALMTELLELDGSETVLEVETGSGYQATVLSRIAKEVYAVEIIPSLAQRAERALSELGYKNVQVKTEIGFCG